MKKLMCGVLIVVMMLSLVACGSKLSGTYKTDSLAGSYVSYTFSGSKVTFTTYVLGTKAIETTGTYKIDGNEITFTWDNGEESKDALSGTQTYEKTEDGIKIGILSLKKA